VGTFTEAEVEYLNSQPLGRIATVGSDGSPHVMPVGVFYDPEAEAIVIGGAGDMVRSKKCRARDTWIHVFPKRILALGMDSDSYELTARDVA
jgi:pyridoxamine 5'-phosphate oxidase family protein